MAGDWNCSVTALLVMGSTEMALGQKVSRVTRPRSACQEAESWAPRRRTQTFQNSGMFDSGPITRNFPIGCGSPFTMSPGVPGADRVATELAPRNEELLLGREPVL